MIKKIKDVITKPKIILRYLLHNIRLFRKIPDNVYLKIDYALATNKRLSLSNPQTYNEKLQWLKLYDRDPSYTKLVDKYAVREFVKERIGGQYLIPLLGVWNTFEEINFAGLPKKFVLKTTHDSGGVVICENKESLNKKKTEKTITKSLNRNYYYGLREWPYKNVKPRIIAEEFLVQKDDDELRDYRFFCFNGEPKFIAVDFSINDKSNTRRNLYDLDWNLLPGKISYPNELEKKIRRPEKLDEMISLSKALSNNIPHVRVDFYNIDDKVLFGEMTFYHQSGFGRITPLSFSKKIGEWIKIEKT